MIRLLKILCVIFALTIGLIIFYVSVKSTIRQQQNTKENVATSSAEVGVEKWVLGDERWEMEVRAKQPRLDRVFQRANVSWYDRTTCGKRIYGKTCKTASGEIFNEEALTMACSYDFALGDGVELCHDGNCITARCNDRGGFVKYGRTFDLSRGSFRQLAPLSAGVIEVEWRIIE